MPQERKTQKKAYMNIKIRDLLECPQSDQAPRLWNLTQLSMKFFMLINLKLLAMPNSFLLNIAEHEDFSDNGCENVSYCWHFHIYEHWKIHAQLSWAAPCSAGLSMKTFYNLGARTIVIWRSFCYVIYYPAHASYPAHEARAMVIYVRCYLKCISLITSRINWPKPHFYANKFILFVYHLSNAYKR